MLDVLKIRNVTRSSLVRCFISVVLTVLINVPAQFAHAQATPEQKAAAIQVIINMLLMDGDSGPIKLVLDDVSAQQFGLGYGSGDHRNGLEVLFEGTNQEITLCLYAQDIQAGEVSVSLNGEDLGELADGENCFTFSAAQQLSGENTLELIHNAPGDRWGVSNIGYEFSTQTVLGLPRLTRLQWNETAVRKVLSLFAFGGHAHDAQITQWANTNPETAIREMLNFSKHNPRLSPLPYGEKYYEPASQHGTFSEFSTYLASANSRLPIDVDDRERFDLSSYDRQGAFFRMATTRGLNPFRQRIGLWETNYHLAVNRDANVSHRQLVRYYDEIMNAHESGVPYEQVLAVASKSAAIAMQYGHRRNRWVNGECLCNDDFAREIHQLFFGILGAADPQGGLPHHEEVTIPQTARMLTDMAVDYDDDIERHPDYVTFGTALHHTAPLNILNATITGANASQKIDNLVRVSIEHPESLDALPIMIISGLADNNLTPGKIAQLRAAWAAMGSNKNFLEFIHAYATSALLHSTDQYKYLTSFERSLYMANKAYLTNTEALLDRTSFVHSLRDENVEIFKPAHNVFGGQTSLEAANSAVIFETNYNRSTQDEYRFRDRGTECDDCDLGSPWLKDWGQVIPTNNGGNYVVGEVARWLWKYAIGSLDNFSDLEEAHLISILGATRTDNNNARRHQSQYFDLTHLLCVRQEILDNPDVTNKDVSLLRLTEWDGFGRNCAREGDPYIYSPSELTLLQRFYTSAEISSTPHIQTLLAEIRAQSMPLGASAAARQKLYANERVQSALAFIFATPFAFVEEKQ